MKRANPLITNDYLHDVTCVHQCTSDTEAAHQLLGDGLCFIVKDKAVKLEKTLKVKV